MFRRLLAGLTPSLRQPVRFPGRNMHGQTADSIFSGPVTSAFSAARFDENPFTCQCEKEDKKVFIFSHFYWSFLSDVMAVKELTPSAKRTILTSSVV